MKNEQDEYFGGTLRIRNPKTLRRWIRTGEYQKLIDQGYIFAVGCGRFRMDSCTCNKCRKTIDSPLEKVLEDFHLHLKLI